ncbi:hypothetical protein [Streptomyces echinatus]|uniref:Uncharacterized protein n=1 Tax=Streptomyces echinatus TaxID=67293 RepID=A0A7W9US47_9ACTN|nr:hypothetical protein [Streptomyces echinatus]MBB5928229.1 hypothetical protein [Streptomyces echinatus]
MLLAFLREPCTVEDIVGHRRVHRPHVEAPQVEPVERRTATRRPDRLIHAGLVTEVEHGLFRTAH